LDGIDPALDVGYLSCGKSHDLVAFVFTKEHVEIVEVATGGSHDEHATLLH
jgi:hypothetical protein